MSYENFYDSPSISRIKNSSPERRITVTVLNINHCTIIQQKS